MIESSRNAYKNAKIKHEKGEIHFLTLHTIFTPTTKSSQHTSQLSSPTEPYSQH